MNDVMLRPDTKGRITLGELAKGVSSYKITKGDNGQLTLTPYAEVPYSAKWIFENPDLLEQFKRQIANSQIS